MKTLAIRLEDEQHARLSILAKLSDVSLTDTIRDAIEAHLAKLAADPTISAKAEELTAAIAARPLSSTTPSPPCSGVARPPPERGGKRAELALQLRTRGESGRVPQDSLTPHTEQKHNRRQTRLP